MTHGSSCEAGHERPDCVEHIAAIGSFLLELEVALFDSPRNDEKLVMVAY